MTEHVTIMQLWLPILLSSVFVFLVSWAIHMLPLWHRSDYPQVPNEDKFMEALRPLATPPGDYMVPRPANHKEMCSPEHQEKLKKGPVMIVTVLPNGVPGMAGSLVFWFLYVLVVGIFAAYIAGRARPVGTHYLEVFRFVGCTAFIGYSLALWQMSIWYKRACGATIKATIDGLIYGLVTAGTFGWLWPR